ncbi:MAG: hypothetical protein EO766_03925 [Hydrotalea sp. AMD]|uniref:hypothetical protein n=1 Tax=Hydrotalea sp. AMD TaxID=2501297 RepID=UPI00094467A8|nr:hypothetical protein [Hydrotalea sp. AMD]RWZ89858.1 MAG: hypothetical protein EO766_03925 [Hydrotalea sp. AMD]
MNTQVENFIPADFSDHSKVWVYQSSRLLTIQEAMQLEPSLSNFTKEWRSHGDPVKGYANLLYGQFIVLMADETYTQVGGCSTDFSVHFIQQIEKQFNIQLFDRQMLAFIIKDKVELLPYSQLEYAIQNGFINQHTLYFNNLIATKKELIQNWIIPAGKSWLGKRFFNLQPAS